MVSNQIVSEKQYINGEKGAIVAVGNKMYMVVKDDKVLATGNGGTLTDDGLYYMEFLDNNETVVFKHVDNKDERYIFRDFKKANHWLSCVNADMRFAWEVETVDPKNYDWSTKPKGVTLKDIILLNSDFDDIHIVKDYFDNKNNQNMCLMKFHIDDVDLELNEDVFLRFPAHLRGEAFDTNVKLLPFYDSTAKE